MGKKYFVIDLKKYGGAEAYKNILGHNQREREYADRPNIVTARSHKNIYFTRTEQTWSEYMAECNEKARASGGRALKKGSSDFFSVVVDCSVMEGWEEEDYVRYLRDAERWLRERFRGQKILASVIHLDEKKPHLHFTVSFFSEERGRWNQRNLAKEATKLDKMLDEFEKEIGAKYGLVRGDGVKRTIEKAKKLVRNAVRVEKRKKFFGLIEEKVPRYDAKGVLRLAKELVKPPLSTTNLQQLFSEYEKTRTEKEKIENRLAETEKELEKAQRELAEKERELEKANERLAEAEAKLETAEKTIDRLEKELEAEKRGEKKPITIRLEKKIDVRKKLAELEKEEKRTRSQGGHDFEEP